MSKHKYFEELCAAAPLGELTPAEAQEFEAHAAGCDACQALSREYTELHSFIRKSDEAETADVVATSRERVEQAMWAGIAAHDEAAARPRLAVLPVNSAPFRRPLSPLLAAAAVLVFVTASFALGIRYGVRYELGAHGVAKVTPPVALPAAASRPPMVAPQPATSTGANTQDAAIVATLKTELDTAQQNNNSLQQKLTADDQQLMQALALQQTLQEQVAQQTSLVKSTQAQLDAGKTALDKAQAAKSSDVATVAALEYQVKDLQEKLGTQTASLDRERDLLSHGREIRDIIGARNLHIIDVYDTDQGGETKKAFARAFYTEGKSLVFYAYDLPQRHDAGNYKYVAWGEKNGDQRSVQKIGFLFHDDQTQKRWSLNFADPKVLSEIDSVFVTLERVNDDVSQPKGKRMLTAYLGTPANHP